MWENKNFMPLQIDLAACYGVEEAHVDAEKQQVLGRWKEKASYIADEKAKLLLRDFLNTPASLSSEGLNAILKFTKRYGPVHYPFTGGREFYDKVSDWLTLQTNLRDTWKRWGRAAAPDHWPAEIGLVEVDVPSIDFETQVISASIRRKWAGFLQDGDKLMTDFGESIDSLATGGGKPGSVRGGVSTIGRFVFLSLFGIEPQRLRFCWRPDCVHPYFIAHTLKAHYCSKECSEWSRAEHKRKWWDEHGAEWREAQKG